MKRLISDRCGCGQWRNTNKQVAVPEGARGHRVLQAGRHRPSLFSSLSLPDALCLIPYALHPMPSNRLIWSESYDPRWSTIFGFDTSHVGSTVLHINSYYALTFCEYFRGAPQPRSPVTEIIWEISEIIWSIVGSLWIDLSINSFAKVGIFLSIKVDSAIDPALRVLWFIGGSPCASQTPSAVLSYQAVGIRIFTKRLRRNNTLQRRGVNDRLSISPSLKLW